MLLTFSILERFKQDLWSKSRAVRFWYDNLSDKRDENVIKILKDHFLETSRFENDERRVQKGVRLGNVQSLLWRLYETLDPSKRKS